jgi:hypothetical protein
MLFVCNTNGLFVLQTTRSLIPHASELSIIVWPEVCIQHVQSTDYSEITWPSQRSGDNYIKSW